MTGTGGGAIDPQASDPRIGEAAEWFACMRGPDAAASQAAYDAWRADPLNAAAYDEIAAVWGATEVGHWAPVVEEHRRKVKTQGAQRASLWRPRVAAALVAGLLATGALSLLWVRPFGGAGAQPRLIASRVGEIRTEKLPDGSTIILDSGTQMTLLLSPAERRIILGDGRARFDVVHDEARPFIVEAAGRAIIDKGTLFDVDVTSGGLVVALLRGSIDVAPLGDSGERAAVRMIAGQVLHAATPSAQPAIIASRELPSWPEGRLSYDRAPLARILADAARYSSRPIRLAEPALGALEVTGVFSVRDPDALADKLAAALGLRAVHSDAEIILMR